MPQYQSCKMLVDLVDINGIVVAAQDYALIATAGDVTIGGYFEDMNGHIMAVNSAYSFSGTISSTATSLLAALSLTAWPDGAVGFHGTLSGGDVAFCRTAMTGANYTTVPTAIAADMASNTTRYPTFSTPNLNYTLGRIG